MGWGATYWCYPDLSYRPGAEEEGVQAWHVRPELEGTRWVVLSMRDGEVEEYPTLRDASFVALESEDAVVVKLCDWTIRDEDTLYGMVTEGPLCALAALAYRPDGVGDLGLVAR